MKRILLISAFTILTLNTYAQITKQWEHYYDYYQMSSGHGVSILIDSTNTPVVIGQQWGWEQTPILHIYRLNVLTGSVLWDMSPSYSQGQYLYTDNSGNIFVTGKVKEGIWKNPFITKYTKNGTQIFYKTENLTPYTDLYSSCFDDKANTYLLMKYLNRFKIQKYDSSGNNLWTVFYEEFNSSNIPGAITFDKVNRNIIFSGQVNVDTTEYISLLRIDSAGWILDTAKFLLNSRIDIKFDHMLSDNQANIYLIGSYSPYQFQNRTFFYKFSPAFDLIWQRTDSTTYTAPKSKFIIQDDGTILRNNFNGCLKYSSAGNLLWAYGTAKFYDLKIGRDNYIYLCGSTGDRYYTCKLSQTGTLIWEITETFSSYPSNTLLSIALDTGMNVYVHGTGAAGGSASRISTIKYSQITPVKSNETEIPHRTELKQNYPNPFNPSTNVCFSLNKKSTIILAIYDISGKELFSLKQNDLNPGEYEYIWNSANCSSGVYFVRLKTDSNSDTKKIMLLK